MGYISCKKCGQSNPLSANTCSKCGARFTSEAPTRIGPDTIVAGQVIANRYVVEKLIGKGGMGCIFQVHDNTLDETVALKTLLPQYVQEKAVVERFFNEARIARGLSHPHIVRVHDIGSADGMVYISMEMLEGRTLRSMLDKVQPGRRIPLNAILRMFDALCAALEYAHNYTVHRDIKPENVMVLKDGTLKLMDFGISKLMGNPNLTSASMVMGTPHYMSPEQLKHSAKVDVRADIYSVGVMLYESLTGDLPTGISRGNDTVRDVPASLDPIIAKCCDRDPAKRYQSANELRVALRIIREQVETQPPVHTPKPERAASGHLVKRLVTVALLGVLGWGAFALWGVAEERRQVANAARATEAAHAGATDIPPTTAAPRADTFDGMATLMEQAKNRASAALSGMEDTPRSAQATRMMEQAEERWRNARGSHSAGDDAQAMAEGWRALHRYLAVAAWPEGMVFIPEGSVSFTLNGRQVTENVDAFFIDEREVSVGEFKAFWKEEAWRFLNKSPYDTDPVTNVAHMDALGYFNLHADGRQLPTPAQWVRALDARRDVFALQAEAEDAEDEDAPTPDATMGWISGMYYELARADLGGATEPEQLFGRSMPTLYVSGTEPEIRAAEGPTMTFEQPGEQVAFRGVLELPATLTQAEQFMR